MAKDEKTKAELAAEAAEMGIEVPAKATKAQIQALIEAKKADSGASEPENGEKAPDSGSKLAVMRVACPGFSGLNVRKAPHMGSPVVKVLENGAEVAVESVDGPWARVDGGYCKAMYLA